METDQLTTIKGAQAVFAVAVMPDGAIVPIKTGEYDVGQADAIAGTLVLMASSIRNAARKRLLE